MMQEKPTRLRFPASHTELIRRVRAALPGDIFVSMVIPSQRKERMVILMAPSSVATGPVLMTQRINAMVWGGKTWEECAEFALDVDSIIASILDDLQDGETTNIVNIERIFPPTPSPEGSTTSSPVYSSAYDLTVSAYNI